MTPKSEDSGEAHIDVPRRGPKTRQASHDNLAKLDQKQPSNKQDENILTQEPYYEQNNTLSPRSIPSEYAPLFQPTMASSVNESDSRRGSQSSLESSGTKKDISSAACLSTFPPTPPLSLSLPGLGRGPTERSVLDSGSVMNISQITSNITRRNSHPSIDTPAVQEAVQRTWRGPALNPSFCSDADVLKTGASVPCATRTSLSLTLDSTTLNPDTDSSRDTASHPGYKPLPQFGAEPRPFFQQPNSMISTQERPITDTKSPKQESSHPPYPFVETESGPRNPPSQRPVVYHYPSSHPEYQPISKNESKRPFSPDPPPLRYSMDRLLPHHQSIPKYHYQPYERVTTPSSAPPRLDSGPGPHYPLDQYTARPHASLPPAVRKYTSPYESSTTTYNSQHAATYVPLRPHMRTAFYPPPISTRPAHPQSFRPQYIHPHPSEDSHRNPTSAPPRIEHTLTMSPTRMQPRPYYNEPPHPSYLQRHVYSEMTNAPPRAPSVIGKYQIIVRQQPVHARMCGCGEKDRRTVDPPPILEVKAVSPQDQNSLTDYAFFVIRTSLWSEDEKTPVLESRKIPIDLSLLIGNLVETTILAEDEHRQKGIFCVFPDLSIRIEGRFKLKFELYDLGSEEGYLTGGRTLIAHTFSDAFNVYSAKDFTGMLPSSALSKVLRDQGLKFHIRKDKKD